MNLRERLRNFPAEQAKLAQASAVEEQKRLLKEKLEKDERQIALNAQLAEWQPRLDQAMAERKDDIEYLKEITEEAASSINSDLKYFQDRLKWKFRFVDIDFDSDLTDPATPMYKPHLGYSDNLTDRHDFRLIPATPYHGRILFGLSWGTCEDHIYFNLLKFDDYIKSDYSRIGGNIYFNELDLKTFGLLRVNDMEIPLSEWHGKPQIIKSTLEKAISNPYVVKDNKSYHPPSSVPPAW